MIVGGVRNAPFSVLWEIPRRPDTALARSKHWPCRSELARDRLRSSREKKTGFTTAGKPFRLYREQAHSYRKKHFNSDSYFLFDESELAR